jgi:hypothetical protein
MLVRVGAAGRPVYAINPLAVARYREAAEIKAELRKPQLHQPVLVETAMGQHTRALLAALDTACNSVEDLGRAAAELFQTHPDYAIITSFPGWRTRPVHGCSLKSVTTVPGSPTPGR